jgi:flavin-dependent dehydrogenase
VRDLLVVGGGPVGLAAAIGARLRGLSVLVVEPRRTPVDKACGEGLMPGTVRALDRLAVHVDGVPFVGIRYVAPDGATTASHRFSAGPGRGVRRTDLHSRLARRAESVGVDRMSGRVVAVRQDGARVQAVVDGAAGGGHQLDARYALACDGLHSGVRRALGLSAGSDGLRFGQRRHAAVAPWSDHVEVHWSSGAEAYVTPVGRGEVGIAVLGPRRLGFAEALAGFPALRCRLDGTRFSTAVRGAGPLRQRVRRRVSGRVLLVGDAAGYVDAVTGEGLRIGLASASAAVDAVASGRVDRYEDAWRDVTRDYRWLTAGLVVATRNPLLRPALVPVAARLPGAFGAAVEVLAR